jgi:hypothetical protein
MAMLTVTVRCGLGSTITSWPIAPKSLLSVEAVWEYEPLDHVRLDSFTTVLELDERAIDPSAQVDSRLLLSGAETKYGAVTLFRSEAYFFSVDSMALVGDPRSGTTFNLDSGQVRTEEGAINKPAKSPQPTTTRHKIQYTTATDAAEIMRRAVNALGQHTRDYITLAEAHATLLARELLTLEEGHIAYSAPEEVEEAKWTRILRRLEIQRWTLLNCFKMSDPLTIKLIFTR